jgi:hypothetical protein
MLNEKSYRVHRDKSESIKNIKGGIYTERKRVREKRKRNHVRECWKM